MYVVDVDGIFGLKIVDVLFFCKCFLIFDWGLFGGGVVFFIGIFKFGKLYRCFFLMVWKFFKVGVVFFLVNLKFGELGDFFLLDVWNFFVESFNLGKLFLLLEYILFLVFKFFEDFNFGKCILLEL